MLHPENLKNVKKLLEEVSRYAESLGVQEINAIVSWFERQWPDYLCRRSQVHSQLQTKIILERRGFECGPIDHVPDWKIGLSPAAMGFSAARIHRILTTAYRAEKIGTLDMETTVDKLTLAMTGDPDAIQFLAEHQILTAPEDWKHIMPWTDTSAMALLESVEEFFKPPKK